MAIEFLGKWEFSMSEYGETAGGAGNVFLKAAIVDAARKALAYL